MELTEDKLIKACQNGNRNAQNQLYLQYKNRLFGVCLRYSKSREEAEDFLQDGFIKIYSDLYQYRPIGSFYGWMRKVMVNICLQHIRKRKDLFSTADIADVAHLHRVDDNVFSEFRHKALLDMVQKLPDGYRTIFNLYAIEGYSHKEIGEQLGLSTATSKSQYSRAKATLRQMLEKYMVS